MRVALLPPPDLTLQSGSAIYARSLASALAEAGVSVAAVVSAPGELTAVDIYRRKIPLPHPIEHDREVEPAVFLECVEAITEALLEAHGDEPVDCIHALYSTFTGYSACLARALTGVPALVSCFGRDVNPGMPAHPTGHRLTADVLRSASHLIASNTATKAAMQQLSDRDSADISVVGMGVDRRDFDRAGVDRAETRARLGWTDDLQVVISVLSSMMAEKGLGTIVEGVLPVLEERANARLIVVGLEYDGGSGHIRRVREHIASSPGGAQVQFLGRQPHDRVASYLAASDVFVDARSVDNFSSSLLEAIAMGKPVIVSRTALRQLGGAECSFPAFSGPEGLSGLLRQLLGNPDALRRYGDRTIRWWDRHQDDLSIEGSVRQVMRIYDRLVEAAAQTGR